MGNGDTVVVRHIAVEVLHNRGVEVVVTVIYDNEVSLRLGKVAEPGGL